MATNKIYGNEMSHFSLFACFSCVCTSNFVFIVIRFLCCSSIIMNGCESSRNRWCENLLNLDELYFNFILFASHSKCISSIYFCSMFFSPSNFYVRIYWRKVCLSIRLSLDRSFFSLPPPHSHSIRFFVRRFILTLMTIELDFATVLHSKCMHK